MLKIVGIDPSLTATGIAHRDGTLAIVHYAKGIDGDRRLPEIYSQITNAVRGASFVVIEDLPKHAKGAGFTGQAQGVLRLVLQLVGVPYVDVAAASLKTFATGSGNAGKPDMRMEWFKRTGADVRDDNMVDAAWLRELGNHLMGVPQLKLPQTHTRALAAVEKNHKLLLNTIR